MDPPPLHDMTIVIITTLRCTTGSTTSWLVFSSGLGRGTSFTSRGRCFTRIETMKSLFQLHTHINPINEKHRHMVKRMLHLLIHRLNRQPIFCAFSSGVIVCCYSLFTHLCPYQIRPLLRVPHMMSLSEMGATKPKLFMEYLY